MVLISFDENCQVGGLNKFDIFLGTLARRPNIFLQLSLIGESSSEVTKMMH